MDFGLRSSCLSIAPLSLVGSGSWTLLTVSTGDGVSEDLTIGEGVEGLVGEGMVDTMCFFVPFGESPGDINPITSTYHR